MCKIGSRNSTGLSCERKEAYRGKSSSQRSDGAGKTTRIVAIRTGCGQSDQLVAQLHFHTDQRAGHVIFMRQQLWPMTGLEPKKRMRYMNRLPQKNVRRCIRDFKKLQLNTRKIQLKSTGTVKIIKKYLNKQTYFSIILRE